MWPRGESKLLLRTIATKNILRIFLVILLEEHALILILLEEHAPPSSIRLFVAADTKPAKSAHGSPAS